jgi:hypothetical protein
MRLGSMLLLGGVALCAFSFVQLNLHLAVATQDDPFLLHLARHKRTGRQAEEPPPERGAFVPVGLDAPMPSSAASGLAIATIGSHQLLALANFYGHSAVYELDATARGLAPRRVQRLATSAAHDWEVLTLPDGSVQLVCAEYDATRSLVYAAAAPDTPPPVPLDGWPVCSDSDERSCANWARSGECARNVGFMSAKCPAACGQCTELRGPLVAVQALDGLGGTASRHVRIADTEGSVRNFLFVANYKAPAGQGVSLYEWMQADGRHRWSHAGYVDVPGAGEAAHCARSEAHADLVVFSSWFAAGSYSSVSPVYEMRVDPHRPNAPPTLSLVQQLQSHGSHDAECFRRAGETYLLLANGRMDTGPRTSPTLLYRYKAGRFVEMQKLPSTDAHDIELVLIAPVAWPDRTPPLPHDGPEPMLLVALANGASFNASQPEMAEVCDHGVDLWRWDDALPALVPFQSLAVSGCSTYVRVWHADGATGGRRTLLAVTVERTTSTTPTAARTTADDSSKSDADGKIAHMEAPVSSNFDAQVHVYEWETKFK